MNKKLFGIVACLCLFSFNLFSQHKEITLDGIWKRFQFYPRGVYGFEPMKNGDVYTVRTATGIEKFNFETGEKLETLITVAQLQSFDGNFRTIDEYQFDHDEKRILIASQYEDIYRRSGKAFHYIYDTESKKIALLSDTNKGKQSFASFSPQGDKVAFVRDNNIFIKDLVSGRESEVTVDGKENEIKNGIADWVYEEELSLSKAFEWSPDGAKIAYMRFDEKRVKEFSMTFYGSLYPKEFTYKYPKAGEDNSLVDIYIYDIATDQKMKLDMGDNSNCYFPRIYWLPNSEELITLKLNRHQNKLEFFRYNTETRQQDIVFTDENECWVDVHDVYHFLKDGSTMFTTSERDGYNHIYKIEWEGSVSQITKGNWEVAEICAIDQAKKLIYYLSNESSPLNRDLYVIGFDGKKKKLVSSGGGWNQVSFSPNTHYYLNVYSDIGTPPVYSIHRSNGKQVRILQDNSLLKKTIEEYGFMPKELFTFNNNEGISLNGWMIKPRDFNPANRYPVLMYVYGGPGSQEVNNSWFRSQDLAWYQMLAQKGYIVVCVDGRGTAGRGDRFKKSIYKQMGKLESEDQIAAAVYLKTLPYVDPGRIGIWGWSFGGYLSSLSLFKSKEVFKMAIAVAPVTNWRYYDNIYTERFLQTPQENPSGYDDNSPLFHAPKLHGHYLLIHGMTDDNVHFQNAVDLTTALIRSNKQFDHFFYPNMNHFINEGTARHHLYTKLTEFITENL